MASLSVSTDPYVAVVGRRKDTATYGIFFYSPNGEITTVIEGYGLEKPMNAVRTSTGSWLVGNGANDTLDCIYELAADGHLLDKYGGQPGSGDAQLHRPFHVALSPDGKQILVADFDSRRVLILDRQPLRAKRVLIETSGNPVRLYFVKPTGVTKLLMVTDGLSVWLYGLQGFFRKSITP